MSADKMSYENLPQDDGDSRIWLQCSCKLLSPFDPEDVPAEGFVQCPKCLRDIRVVPTDLDALRRQLAAVNQELAAVRAFLNVDTAEHNACRARLVLARTTLEEIAQIVDCQPRDDSDLVEAVRKFVKDARR